MVPLSFNFHRLVGVDLGSSQIRIWSDQAGLLVDEPACLAVDERSQKVLAVGQEALAMRGRVGQHIKLHYPIKKGQVFDLTAARAMLRLLLQPVLKRSLFSPVIMVSVPSSKTKVTEKIVTQLFYSLGAQEVYTIVQPLAAAIGAGVPIADASGGFVMQMGAGLVEAAVISLGSLVAHETSYQAGERADQQIMILVRKKQQLAIGQEIAEKLKKQVAAIGENHQQKLLIAGQNIVRQAPQELEIDSTMLAPAMNKLAKTYETMLKKLLSRIPPELTVDVIDKGLLLSGGWAQLSGWEEFLIQKLGIPVSVVEEPEKTVIKGIATVLEHLDEFKESLGYQRG